MDSERKLQAIIAELEQQRNWALTRCAAMAAELAAMKAKIPAETEAARPAQEPGE